MTDIEQLKAAALAATPGPWDFDNRETPYQIQGGEVCGGDALPWGDVYTMYEVETIDADGDACSEPQLIAEMVSIENGRFMRAANPATILDLIAQLDAAKKDAGRHTKALSQIADLHSFEDSTHGQANAMYDARCIALTAMQAEVKL